MSSPKAIEPAAAGGAHARELRTSPGGGASPALKPLSLRESDSAALRPVIATLEGEFASLDAQVDLEGYGRASEQLGVTWRRLVALLALGPPPELRTCPYCKHEIRRVATRCIQCWKQSPAGLEGSP
jgi:hypothetical protein